MSGFKFELIENVGVISEKPSGWSKELNFVKWGDHEPKFDIREWSADHTKMGKGVTLTVEELKVLKTLIEEALS